MSLLLLFGDNATPGELDLLYKPIRDEIARLLRSRTTGEGGELGYFANAADPGGPTNPTADEVDLLIDDAAAMVATRVGAVVPLSVLTLTRRTVSVQTAMLIEVGSEEFVAERYDRLAALLEALIAALLLEIEQDPVIDALDHGGPIGLASGMTGRWGIDPDPD